MKILIVAEHDGATVREIAFELLGLARRIAGTEADEVKAIVLGKADGLGALAESLASRGASEVLCLESPALERYSVDAHRRALEPVIREEAPALVLLGHTPNGWDVAPPLAARLDAPLVTGCSKIVFADGKAAFTRKAFNGKFVHEVEVATADAPTILATIDKGASAPFDGTTSGTVKSSAADVAEDALRARFVAIQKGESSGLDLKEADIIVSAGRGVGAPEKLDVVRALAEALGGQLGASRAVTDAGWLPHEHQIGSSGVSVSPKLYIACGISGAIQHVVGMKGSSYIVAINKDADAPIFGIADLGVVGDLFEIVPALTEAVKKARG